MSAGVRCTDPAAHRPHWVVTQRKCNHSRFNGGRWTRSDYSEVICPVRDCYGRWRTKAAYVDDLPDATRADLRYRRGPSEHR